eukprot:m.261296 g.261296  ORF g.261296 m.261296 type:complete len:168 (+) comp11045_c0_seq21:69-572(+)
MHRSPQKAGCCWFLRLPTPRRLAHQQENQSNKRNDDNTSGHQRKDNGTTGTPRAIAPRCSAHCVCKTCAVAYDARRTLAALGADPIRSGRAVLPEPLKGPQPPLQALQAPALPRSSWNVSESHASHGVAADESWSTKPSSHCMQGCKPPGVYEPRLHTKHADDASKS